MSVTWMFVWIFGDWLFHLISNTDRRQLTRWALLAPPFSHSRRISINRTRFLHETHALARGRNYAPQAKTAKHDFINKLYPSECVREISWLIPVSPIRLCLKIISAPLLLETGLSKGRGGSEEANGLSFFDEKELLINNRLMEIKAHPWCAFLELFHILVFRPPRMLILTFCEKKNGRNYSTLNDVNSRVLYLPFNVNRYHTHRNGFLSKKYLIIFSHTSERLGGWVMMDRDHLECTSPDKV